MKSLTRKLLVAGGILLATGSVMLTATPSEAGYYYRGGWGVGIGWGGWGFRGGCCGWRGGWGGWGGWRGGYYGYPVRWGYGYRYWPRYYYAYPAYGYPRYYVR